MTLPFDIDAPKIDLNADRPANAILAEKPVPEADVCGTDAKATIRQRKATIGRELRDVRRTEIAADAIAGFDRDVSIYGFTKGQFSLIDLLDAAIEITGPVHLTVSTWTAAGQDVSRVLQFIDSGKILSARWLVDLTFCRRTPQLAARIRQTFGDDAIRVAKNHAKFSLLENDEWRVVCETSMNLNHNPRFENFRLTHDPELAAFLGGMLGEIWTKQDRRMSDERPYDIHKHFAGDL